MTQMTQEEIITNTKTVIQGLEALKNEHNSILNGLLTSLKAVQQEKPNDTNVVEEKTTIIKKTLESIELGLGEAQVIYMCINFNTEFEKIVCVFFNSKLPLLIFLT